MNETYSCVTNETMISQFIHINDENQFLNSWAHIILPVQLSWLTFVRWVRIYNHDAFYEEEIGSWKNELEDYIKIFNSSVDKFEDKTEFIFNNSSYSPDFDSFEYKMLNATIGNYLRD